MKDLYKIGMVGMGSIGTRHLHNIVAVLKERGKSHTIDLIRSGKGKEISAEVALHVNQVYHSYDSAPRDYDVVFVTNPTYLHFETILQFVTKTNHMFIEKPVFDKTNISLESLKFMSKGVYYVACPLRYTDVIQHLKHSFDLKNVYCVRVICSSYLPEWRHSQDYRKTYSAHKEQGGGVSIDLIHEWDYLCYLFGQPEQVINVKGKYSNLEIDSDDLSLYIAQYSNMIIEIHLDYFGRHSIREIQLFTNKDTVVADLVNGEIRFLRSGEVIRFREQRNDYQRREIEHFFDIIEGAAVNDNDISTAIETLRIAKEGK